MYVPQDGLDRLADIYAIERSKADAKAWAALPAEERQRKEDFYRGQQRAAKGFLRMGVVNLKWLNALTGEGGGGGGAGGSQGGVATKTRVAFKLSGNPLFRRPYPRVPRFMTPEPVP